MFTGIIQTTGRLAQRRAAPGGARLEIEPAAALDSPRTGESIAVNGVCLTLEQGSAGRRLAFYLSEETLARSTLGRLDQGAAVNIERSLRLGDRLGGHLVMGHVDGLGRVRRWLRQGEGWRLEVEYPGELAPLLAPKGSIAVDGISLTVAELGAEWFSVAVVPHTAEATNLAAIAPGTPVNLEADMIARYVIRALSARGDAGGKPGLTLDSLRQAGF